MLLGDGHYMKANSSAPGALLTRQEPELQWDEERYTVLHCMADLATFYVAPQVAPLSASATRSSAGM
jgi:hypothetical protein